MGLRLRANLHASRCVIIVFDSHVRGSHDFRYVFSSSDSGKGIPRRIRGTIIAAIHARLSPTPLLKITCLLRLQRPLTAIRARRVERENNNNNKIQLASRYMRYVISNIRHTYWRERFKILLLKRSTSSHGWSHVHILVFPIVSCASYRGGDAAKRVENKPETCLQRKRYAARYILFTNFIVDIALDKSTNRASENAMFAPRPVWFRRRLFFFAQLFDYHEPFFTNDTVPETPPNISVTKSTGRVVIGITIGRVHTDSVVVDVFAPRSTVREGYNIIALCAESMYGTSYCIHIPFRKLLYVRHDAYESEFRFHDSAFHPEDTMRRIMISFRSTASSSSCSSLFSSRQPLFH